MHAPGTPTLAHTEPEARLIGYARVSTADQDPQMQFDALLGARVLEPNIYHEMVSGAAKKRPVFNRMMRELRPGDIIVVWKLDRLGRTLRQLVETVDRIKESGAHLRVLTQQIDTSTALGKVFFAITVAFAEFERDIGIERTRAGLAAAAAQGRKGGARRQYSEVDIEGAAAAFREGASYNKLAPTIRNRRGDKTITPTQLKRRIDEYERRKTG